MPQLNFNAIATPSYLKFFMFDLLLLCPQILDALFQFVPETFKDEAITIYSC